MMPCAFTTTDGTSTWASGHHSLAMAATGLALAMIFELCVHSQRHGLHKLSGIRRVATPIFIDWDQYVVTLMVYQHCHWPKLTQRGLSSAEPSYSGSVTVTSFSHITDHCCRPAVKLPLPRQDCLVCYLLQHTGCQMTTG